MSYPLFLVDAFIDQPFSGNPAGVCVLREEQPASWMQSVALEMNQAETAFVQKRADGSWNLRWFTPQVEVNLCGHATLAAAHAAHPERFVRGAPTARRPPAAVYINPPKELPQTQIPETDAH